MNLLKTSTMNYVELSKEIDKTKKKIKDLQDTIKVLEKLQVAEQIKNTESRNRPEWK